MNFRWTVPAVLLLLTVSQRTVAKTWQILNDGSGDAPSVQAGIDSAAAGDTVLVHPGTYHEMIAFQGRDIVVLSASGPQSTVLDATGLGGRVVTVQSGEHRATVLEGFTITHGIGGVIVLKAQPSLIGNIITENDEASASGGGLWFSSDTPNPLYPMIADNVISNNHAANDGGGIGFGQRMVPEVYNNHIEGNEAGSGNGGGIYLRGWDGGARFSDNIILNNRAGDHGGGIYVVDPVNPEQSGALQISVFYNLIAGNLADGRTQSGNSGGGIWLSHSYALVQNNTIVGNTGNGPYNGYGGGIVMEGRGNPTVTKNIIAFTQQGGGIWCGDGAYPIVQNNLAWQNSGGDAVDSCATWGGEDGNIMADPIFCAADLGDYTLAENSPAITDVAGPLGCFPSPGCGPIAVQPTTWGKIKALYR